MHVEDKFTFIQPIYRRVVQTIKVCWTLITVIIERGLLNQTSSKDG